MIIERGTRLGPYEVVSRIGAGGMGEVWQARDTRLDRSVAVKVLPAEFAGNAQLRLRFEREAKTISQLNHPNICTLFDVGENYLVMELLEGETLADRLARGPLPLSDVLRYGAQIAAALDRAHRSGVVHRDLKPGNIMIGKSGAKLLDFGLATNGAVGTAAAGATEATVQKPLTEKGTILGTFQYMAPEQLEGCEADARTDIFAVGAVLYEMATGARAFDGKTKTSLIAAIVSSMPRPLSELQPLTPPALDHVIAKCLEKAPEDRWQSAHDIAEELRWIGGASASGAAVPLARPKRMRIAMGAAIAFLAALFGAGAMWLVARRTAPKPLTLRTALVLPADAPLAVYGPNRVSISPDGKLVAYVADHSGVPSTSGAGGGWQPRWSPDGRKIFYRSGDRFYEVSVSTGATTVIGKPTLLFTEPAVDMYAVFGDGFLLSKVADPLVSATSISVVLQWIDDLKRAHAS